MTEVQCTERLVSKEILFLAQNINLHPSSVDLRVNAQRPLTMHIHVFPLDTGLNGTLHIGTLDTILIQYVTTPTEDVKVCSLYIARDQLPTWLATGVNCSGCRGIFFLINLSPETIPVTTFHFCNTRTHIQVRIRPAVCTSILNVMVFLDCSVKLHIDIDNAKAIKHFPTTPIEHQFTQIANR